LRRRTSLAEAMVKYYRLFASSDDFSAGLTFRDESVTIKDVDMPSEDVDALVAYLSLLTQLVDNDKARAMRAT
jgi:hypothetical protein